MKNENLICFNGSFFKENEAHPLMLDRGLYFGDGVFESMRACQGKILGRMDHIHRLFEGMKVLQIQPSWTPEEIEKWINQIIEKSGLEDCYLRLTITRGKWMGSIPPMVPTPPQFILTCRRFLPFREELYEKGYQTLTLSTRRNETSPLSQIKSLNYLDNILGRMTALEKGYDEGIFLNTQGFLTEGTASNLFLIKGNLLLTPRVEDGILPGVTRKIILEKVRTFGLEVKLTALNSEEILTADEAFLTNSLMGIVPWVGTKGDENHPCSRPIYGAVYDIGVLGIAR
ncbi:MAG: aminotransferase class IV [Chlamydiae bacterium]|nr:aminotransferase class IV [Chlamydiota bacterium]